MAPTEVSREFLNHRRRLMWLFVGAATIAIVDQAIKFAIVTAKPHVMVIPGFFAINFTTNSGAAFGLFRQFPAMLTALGVGVLVGLVVYSLRSAATATPFTRTALALLIGGAVGNLIDRIRLGHVVDYLAGRPGMGVRQP